MWQTTGASSKHKEHIVSRHKFLNQSFNLIYQDAWVARNGEEERLPGLDYTPSQLFWLSGASVWCAKYRDQALRLRLMSGVHSPDMVRVKATLANMPEFANDWQCPLGSNMNPASKCSVW